MVIIPESYYKEEKTVKLTQSEIDLIIKSAVVSSIIVCAYGLYQTTGREIFAWAEPFLVTGRITSTVGQSNFLASYLLLVIPLTLYLLKSSRKVWERIVLALIFIIQIVNLFFTYSRAGWLGLLGGGFFMLVVFIFTSKSIRSLVRKRRALDFWH